ncbi:MAG: permease-like cell division protein FtsX [Clostridia bacterium]|nr:permease-like cell division protein FtsX [Clostridia bacterium]
MKKFSLSFALSKSFSQIGKTLIMSIATILALTGSLVILGMVGLLQYTVDVNLADLTTEGQAVIFLQSDCTESEVEQVRVVLENYRKEGYLSEYTFVSKEEALREEIDRFKDHPQLFQSLQTGLNPYRDAFELTAAESDDITNIIENLYGLSLVRVSEGGENVPFAPVANAAFHSTAIDSIDTVMSVLRAAGLVLFTVLLLGGLFILINTIRLAVFGRSQELAVMRYVGANRAFMTSPFLMQGLVLGFFSSIAAFGIQWYLYEKAIAYLGAQYAMITLSPFASLWYYILAAFLFVGVLVGLVGGALSVACYMQEKA